MIAAGAGDAQLPLLALIALVVLVIAVGAATWLRTRGTSGASEAIRLVAVRAMGGKRLLAVVEVERQRFLLGLTDESVSCLARISREPACGADARDDAAASWARQSA
ncbi:MAG: flagellar biosynthetic protein FliO [Thermodesulfobacteriota bacterium]